jgi:alpha-amylase/alpha-mannosidase (GH57 family)
MATRKKKEVLENVPSGGWPKINQGSHLTVKTFEDGRTELIWDDEQLLKEVRAAILKAESVLPVSTEDKPKRTRKKKEAL